MADARSLLKAKRQEARISHPYATYTASNQLKCSICGVVIKHASAWEGHLGSKAHRTNVAQLRQQQEQERAAAASQAEEEEEEEGSMAVDLEAPSKRKAGDREGVVGQSEESLGGGKKRKLERHAKAGFPDDFFSDPGRKLPERDDEEDDEEDGDEENNGGGPSNANGSTTQSAGPSDSVIDEEFERFQREMMRDEQMQVDPVEAYQRATVMAEPELLTAEQVSGFSGRLDASGAGPVVEKTPEEIEEEKRKQKEQDERELIMDRLLEEERIQEEADMRVSAMKSRLEALKKKRESRKAGRSQQDTSS